MHTRARSSSNLLCVGIRKKINICVCLTIIFNEIINKWLRDTKDPHSRAVYAI